jgi:hypothetical protein
MPSGNPCLDVYDRTYIKHGQAAAVSAYGVFFCKLCAEKISLDFPAFVNE